MRPVSPPPTPQPPRGYPGRAPWLPVTRLRVGRVVLLVFLGFVALVGGAVWLLMTQARPRL
jgi:hypothetical protein